MPGGIPVVAKAIAELTDELPVKQCLQALFSYELENAQLKTPHFSERYEKELTKHAKQWSPPRESEG
jgi:hypothetical protein